MLRLRAAHSAVNRLSMVLVRILRWAVFFILLYLILAVNVTILLRALFGISLPWIMDSAVLVAPFLAFFSAAVAFSIESHPRMRFTLDKLPPRFKYTVGAFIHAITVTLMGLCCYFSWSYAQLGKSVTITSMDFLTLYPFYLSLPIGFAAMAIVSFERLLYLLIYECPEPLAEEGS